MLGLFLLVREMGSKIQATAKLREHTQGTDIFIRVV